MNENIPRIHVFHQIFILKRLHLVETCQKFTLVTVVQERTWRVFLHEMFLQKHMKACEMCLLYKVK